VLIVIQALVVLLLFALAGARRFGVTRPPPPDHRSTEALLELATRVLLSRQRSRRITHSYVMRVLEATANDLGVPPSRTMAARARGLDKLAHERGVEGGAVELADAFMTDKRRSARAHVELARRAYQLRQRLLARRFAPPPRRSSKP
jgi:hypothetical protein